PAPEFEQQSLEELMAEEELEMARKEREKVAETPGSGAPDSDVQEETAGYTDAIQNAIQQRWRIPGNYRNRDDLSVRVRLRVIPGGEVVSVEVDKSSGYPNFDESLVKAVELASPLPVPDGKLFEQFRTFQIVFRPTDVK
ncbi:MAG TPA: cell envelope integrity protein TolA, partial [Alcanivorax sp.]|nr:cell envelope integrity protein TolA [Alcanivorax sp.]HBP70127.1 cell envelope integrity protein TolA [Alcanivorax sp.]HBT07112.1 cell envelope integrity protein TolA [Alcanivorax sp.]